MRRSAFDFLAPDGKAVQSRHRARSLNFNDQSVFSYSSRNKHWWGYA